jgi:DNA-binding protein H-NS
MNSPNQKPDISVVQSARENGISDLQLTVQDTDEIQKILKANKEKTIDKVVRNFLNLLKAELLTLEDVAPLLFPEFQKNGEAARRKRRGGSTSKGKLKSGTVYQDPNSSETWTAGGKGARPKWIQNLLKDSVDMTSLVLIDSPQSKLFLARSKLRHIA